MNEQEDYLTTNLNGSIHMSVNHENDKSDMLFDHVSI